MINPWAIRYIAHERKLQAVTSAQELLHENDEGHKVRRFTKHVSRYFIDTSSLLPTFPASLVM